MKQFYYCVIFLIAAGFSFGKESKDIAEVSEIKPGKHAKQKCDDSEFTYDLYVPKSYAEKTDEKFPAVFISCPGGRPQKIFRQLEKWAEKENCLLVTVNESKNALDPSTLYEDMQRSIMRAVKRKVRLHPYLRFSIGASGAGWASLHYSLQFPNEWAGVVVLIHSGNGLFAPRHCAVSFLAGEKDKTHGIDAVRRAYYKTKNTGNPTHLITYPDKGHGGIPPEDYQKELSWMLNLMTFAHPKITETEKKKLLPLINEKIKALSAETDMKKKTEQVEELLYIPWLKKTKNYSMIARGWFDVEYDRITKVTLPAQQWTDYKELANHERKRYYDSKKRSKVSSDIRKLERNPDVAKEKKAAGRLAIILRKDDLMRRKKRLEYKKIMKMKGDYEDFLKRYAGTIASTRAKQQLDMLPKFK